MYITTQIYEGPELNIEKRLARLSGPNIPQDVTVGSNETLVRFFTDGSVNFFPGFYASFTEINWKCHLSSLPPLSELIFIA